MIIKIYNLEKLRLELLFNLLLEELQQQRM